jgi:hypothetical protein
MRAIDRRMFLKQVGLGLGAAATVSLMTPLSPAKVGGQANSSPPEGVFASGRIIGVGEGILLLTNRKFPSLPILISNGTRIWKGRDVTIDKVKVGDYAYVVTAPLPDGKLAAVSVWLNLTFPAAEIISRNGDTLRVRAWGDPRKEGEIRLTPEIQIWRDGPANSDVLVPGVRLRILGTVLPDKTLLAYKIFAGPRP